MKLVVFLRKLANESVTVDLKSNTSVTGTVLGVDMQMNMHVKNAKVSTPGRETVPMEQITLRGNTIRSVTLPDNLALDTLLTDKEARKRPAVGKGKEKLKAVAVVLESVKSRDHFSFRETTAFHEEMKEFWGTR